MDFPVGLIEVMNRVLDDEQRAIRREQAKARARGR